MLIVFCPNCRIPVRDERCPQCGAEIDPAAAESPSSIRISPPAEEAPVSPPKDWKAEVRRKLEVHARKKGTAGPEDAADSEQEDEALADEPVRPVAEPSTRPALSAGRIERPLVVSEPPAAGRSRIVTFADKASLADVPSHSEMMIGLDDPSSDSREEEEEASTTVVDEAEDFENDFDEELASQETFTFDDGVGGEEEEDAAERPAGDDFPEDTEEAPHIAWVSREIFLSRILAGLVDLIWPAFLGVVFAYAAAWWMGHDFYTSTSGRIAIALGVFWYLFGCTFFLSVAGQTPGMQLAGIRLLHNESPDIPLGTALLRVILFLPVVATLAGLLWGLFDPLGRCLHDRASSTRVILETPRHHPTLSLLE